MIESLLLERFFSEPVRTEVLDEIRRSPASPAAVYGGAHPGVDARVRSAQLIAVPEHVRDLVRRRLLEMMSAIGDHFGVMLQTCEEPQFLRYQAGDFFVAHQDGNTPLIRDDSRHRRVSAVVFLNPSSVDPIEGAYGGGSLVLHGRRPNWEQRYVVPPTVGSLVAFRAEATHEVTPVTHGVRYTIAAFYR
jgi:SM-20-related protein